MFVIELGTGPARLSRHKADRAAQCHCWPAAANDRSRGSEKPLPTGTRAQPYLAARSQVNSTRWLGGRRQPSRAKLSLAGSRNISIDLSRQVALTSEQNASALARQAPLAAPRLSAAYLHRPARRAFVYAPGAVLDQRRVSKASADPLGRLAKRTIVTASLDFALQIAGNSLRRRVSGRLLHFFARLYCGCLVPTPAPSRCTQSIKRSAARHLRAGHSVSRVPSRAQSRRGPRPSANGVGEQSIFIPKRLATRKLYLRAAGLWRRPQFTTYGRRTGEWTAPSTARTCQILLRPATRGALLRASPAGSVTLSSLIDYSPGTGAPARTRHRRRHTRNMGRTISGCSARSH